MKKPNREISALYLELASDCFAKAATAEDIVTAEGLRRMAERYMIQAVALNPTIGHRHPDAERLTANASKGEHRQASKVRKRET